MNYEETEISVRNDDKKDDILEGKNPVTEALKSGLTVNKIFISDRNADKTINKIIKSAKDSGIPYVFTDKKRLDEISITGRHQGVIAVISQTEYSDIEDIFEIAAEKNESPFIFVLDGIEDPHNMGAIIRTAHEAGAHGVIISKRHSSGITPTVARSAAGACAHMNIVRVSNISQTIVKLKKKGVWFLCGDMDGEVLFKQDIKGSIGIVIGNEGHGVSPLVKKNCDMTASIPMYGQVGSLNASVAAGVLAYEVVRQRRFCSVDRL